MSSLPCRIEKPVNRDREWVEAAGDAGENRETNPIEQGQLSLASDVGWGHVEREAKGKKELKRVCDCSWRFSPQHCPLFSPDPTCPGPGSSSAPW